jgi:Mannosyl-glycoprotein endo-beta-N-acetylglucosaminidase
MTNYVNNQHNYLVPTFVIAFLFTGFSAGAASYRLPEIISGPLNTVPACVTPNLLMRFIKNRNHALDPFQAIGHRFSNIASVYKSIGECVQKSGGTCIGIRWDYAFFQMLIETNYLTFTRPGGQPGGVRAEDYNFAGIGATIAGKRGERFHSLREGVHAHLQHVLMYAGIPILSPIAKRTRLVQNEVVKEIKVLGRPATFMDLATLWTATLSDSYATSIDSASKKFTDEFLQSEWPPISLGTRARARWSAQTGYVEARMHRKR